MVIGLYVPSMCEKASASAIFCGASFVDALCFPYLLWLYVRPRFRNWEPIVDAKLNASACAGSSEVGVRKGAHVTQHVLIFFVEGSFPCF